MKRVVVPIVGLMFLMVFQGHALAHPSESYKTFNVNGPRYASMGMPPVAARGDMTFTSHYPDPVTLSQPELYILTGGQQENSIQLPWYLEVYFVLAAGYSKTHSLPSQLSDSYIEDAVHGGEPLPAVTLQRFHSPLTDRYPVLTASSTSIGDLFVRVLSDDDVRYFEDYDRTLKAYAEHQTDTALGIDKPMKLAGPVMYFRLYGQNGVILERLVYQGVPNS